MQIMQDERLVERAKRGDRDAFGALYEAHAMRFYRYAYYRLGRKEDAEDAVADAVLAMWRQLGQLREEGAFLSWAYRILSAACDRKIRGQIRRRKEVSVETPEGSRQAEQAGRAEAAGTEASVSRGDPEGVSTRMMLEQALARLEEDERRLVLLSAVAGLNSREIGRISGMKEGSVRSKLSRSYRKMRDFWEEDGIHGSGGGLGGAGKGEATGGPSAGETE